MTQSGFEGVTNLNSWLNLVKGEDPWSKKPLLMGVAANQHYSGNQPALIPYNKYWRTLIKRDDTRGLCGLAMMAYVHGMKSITLFFTTQIVTWIHSYLETCRSDRDETTLIIIYKPYLNLQASSDKIISINISNKYPFELY